MTECGQPASRRFQQNSDQGAIGLALFALLYAIRKRMWDWERDPRKLIELVNKIREENLHPPAEAFHILAAYADTWNSQITADTHSLDELDKAIYVILHGWNHSTELYDRHC